MALGGGSDTGVGPGQQDLRGPTAAMLALVAAALCALPALTSPRLRAALRSGPGALAVGGVIALATWAAISMAWADGPALAWIEVNRLALYALVLVVAIAAARPGAGRWRGPAAVAVVTSLATVPLVAWALLGKCVPQILGGGASGRLGEPLPSFNGLAVAAVMAMPGALLVATRAGRHGIPRWAGPAAAGWLALLLATLVLTLSRTGILAAVACLAVMIGLGPHRDRLLATLLAAIAGAAPGLAFGLGADALSRDGLEVSERLPQATLLGLLLLGGAGLAAALAALGARLLARTSDGARRRFTIGTVTAFGLLVAAAAALVGSRLGSDESIGNDPGRLPSASLNNRAGWWQEALRAFADRPLSGHGAGSFPLVHLREREDLTTLRHPHNALLQQMSDLGVVGAAAWIALVAGLVWAGVRVARRHGRGAAGPGLAVIAAFLVNAMLDWAWAIPGLVMVPLAVGGVLVGSLAAPAERRSRVPAGVGAVACAVVAASAVLPWASTALNDHAWHRVATDPAGARDEARLAADLNPLDWRPLRTEAFAERGLGSTAGRLRAAAAAVEREPDNAFAVACQVGAIGPGGTGYFPALRRLEFLVPRQGERLTGSAGC